MKILLIKNNRLYSYKLPIKVKDNFWITDIDGYDNSRNLINVVAKDGIWVLTGNYETKIVSGNSIYNEVNLTEYNFYVIKNENEKDFYYLYVVPDVERNYKAYNIIADGSLKIGKSQGCNILYGHSLVDELHAELYYQQGKWAIVDNNSKFGVYVNDKKYTGSQKLEYGDVIFIAGLKIIVMNGFLLINNINNYIQVVSPILQFKKEEMVALDNQVLKEEELDRKLYAKEDYFYRSPRFIEDVIPEKLAIEDPPAKIPVDDNSLLMTIGPMFTMGLTSMTTVFTTINTIMESDPPNWKKGAPSLIIAGAMLCSMIVWPLINKKLDKKKKIKREKERITKFSEYLDGKKNEIERIIQKQSQTLKDKYIPLQECENIILRRKSNMWERSLDQNDFLALRLGLGNIPVFAEINYSKEKFQLEEQDELKVKIKQVVEENNMLNNVPIVMSFIEKYITSIIGNPDLTQEFFKGLLLQIMTFHSYEFLKIVVLTDEEHKYKWDYLKDLPYLFDDSRQVRFYATNMDETKEISLYLEKIYQQRKSDGGDKFSNNPPYYLIITDNYHLYRDIEIINDILVQTNNPGFSLMIFSEKLQNLPSECRNFINVNKDISGIFESEISKGHQREFKTEFCDNLDFKGCIQKISNTPIEFSDEEKQLPSSISFLGMYGVGKIDQLNINNRWNTNNSQKSLGVTVGIEKSGMPLKLDLHEKYHGPHGLIAGMTGSGKSEFIITYILSLAINFSPLDVNFILIDYKGGGLAGAFENRETGVRLPHLAGTITNLDVAEMNRSLASIQSELRRRQQIFNDARDKLGESTVDIYKYQKFYKNGLVEEPIPHLFIISDEFAELKSQQPEFMEQLISAARIGRSLGIHLILATQKPSGVVNDQIWSNSRFRVCLKVQDKNDSSEMIKRPDAASLKNAGRFYLQVGYNELFALGQSGWAGAQYFPTDKLKKKTDQSLVVIDNIGNAISNQDDNKDNQTQSEGEELGNVLKAIIDTAKENNLSTKQLWLEKILANIYSDNLATKYDYKAEPFILNPIIGEYDDPNNQRQDILTLNLTIEGNSSIYGSAGSGKEMFVSTMIYSLCKYHSPEEVNIYALDFGAGTLARFKEFPQVGDVVLPVEEEKVNNIIRLIETEIEKRKKLFVNYSGDYQSYIKRSGKTVPVMLVIINNYDTFQDSFDFDERLNQITRECTKYGIIIVTTVNTTSGMRYKLRQNFKSDITLQFNDQDDYSVIIGNTKKLFPSTEFGRGLVKLDKIYEFQTARICSEEEEDTRIPEIINELKTKYPGKKAPVVPSVPKVVTVKSLLTKLKGLGEVPLGINKETIDAEKFNFLTNFGTVVSATDYDLTYDFTKAMITMLSKCDQTNVVLFDLDGNNKSEYPNNVSYIASGYDVPLKKVLDNIDYQYDIYVKDGYSNKNLLSYKKMVIVFAGLNKLLLRMNEENKNRLFSVLEKIKDMGTFAFILIDQSESLKKYEFERWFKNAFDTSYGIWVGNGIADQTLLKTNIGFKKTNNEIPKGYGIIVKNTKVKLVNLITLKDSDSNE